ncbi:MAG TPA: SurA N-terminal domain-containing protein [bacterium]|nr:SurA N-terminal domain-containing protein [bacterium]
MMIKWFRKKRNIKIIMIITALLVIPGFVIWGVSFSGDNKKYLAAKVNNQPIYLNEFYRTVDETKQQYRDILKENYSKLVNETELEKMILSRMIQDKLLEQLYKKYHIRVKPAEIMDVVKAEPAFKNEKGQFDEARFKAYFSRMSPEKTKEVEDQIRSAIQYHKLKQEVLSETTIVVDDADIKTTMGNAYNQSQFEDVKRRIQMQKEEQYFQDWLQKQISKAKIEIYLNLDQKVSS